SRNVSIDGVTLVDLVAGNALQIRDWLETLPINSEDAAARAITRATDEIRFRIQILQKLGLEELPWNRGTGTFSTGERERLSVASLLSRRTVHALYLLDEPTRGLHPIDRLKLIDALKLLQTEGNTLLVVEHDPLFLQHADWIVELGPGSGEQGGEVLYSGPRDSYTANLTPPNDEVTVKPSTRRNQSGRIRLHREAAPTVEFPLGVLCVVTGVSGSGKSRLVTTDLADALNLHLLAEKSPHEIECEIEGGIDELICMDERPAPLSSHSTPATLLHVWSEIRKLFSATDEARRRNFDIRAFGLSTNSPGRCPACAGRGVQLVDLQFLPDAQIVCPECRGSRYRPDLLEVTYRGLTIDEVLNLGIQQALTHFRGENQVLRKLTSAVALGLESLRLGQPAASLSAGELQRLKLAQHLGKRSGKRTLFLIDEPTAGLHPNDVARLVESLDQLVSSGHSVIAIDHHPQLLTRADEIIDLGTGGGKLHATIAARGPLAEVLANPLSATGKFQSLRG
ncbi:MAG: AAA family ATPase, partial [Planctomycetaceae bacterium]|nr:AAA family ATPase [Planctomycetaceae bacterium]